MKDYEVDIPVPKEVLDRQATIRFARECTSLMFGVPTIPYRFDTPEYAYFLKMMYTA